MSAHDEQQANELERLAELAHCNRFGGGRYCPNCDRSIEMSLDALKAGAAALRRASPETGWQPIETAPKDGTQVLIWIADDALDSGGYVIQAEYVAWDAAPPAEYREGWCNGWDGGYLNEAEVITHWQPLPPAPVEVPHA